MDTDNMTIDELEDLRNLKLDEQSEAEEDGDEETCYYLQEVIDDITQQINDRRAGRA